MKKMLLMLVICSMTGAYAMDSQRYHRVIPVSDLETDAALLTRAIKESNVHDMRMVLEKYTTKNVMVLYQFTDASGKTVLDIFLEKNPKSTPEEFLGRFIKRDQGFNAEDDELRYQQQQHLLEQKQ